jgi:hypothetical protein
MDMARENKMLATRLASADWKLNDIKVEFTSRDTPQQNSLAEVALRTLAGRARAMTVAAKVPPEHKTKFTVVAIQHATVLDNLVPMEIDGITKTGMSGNTESPQNTRPPSCLLAQQGSSS